MKLLQIQTSCHFLSLAYFYRNRVLCYDKPSNFAQSIIALQHQGGLFTNGSKGNWQNNLKELETRLTCVKICHATMIILIDWSGTRRMIRAIIPGLAPRSTDMRYFTAAKAMAIDTTRVTMAATIPQIFLKHFVQVNPVPFTYPPMHTQQSTQANQAEKIRASA